MISRAAVHQLIHATLSVDVRRRVLRCLEILQTASLKKAIREQGLAGMHDKLETIVNDVRHQYSSFELCSIYTFTKTRGMHAFQTGLVEEAFSCLPKNDLSIVDVGDSAGTHLAYLKGLHPDRVQSSLSINIDPEAVRRIQEKGLPARQLAAEDAAKQGVTADIFLCFETLEHLASPIPFLHSLAEARCCQLLVVTVPFVKRSRLGLHHIRLNYRQPQTAEKVHIFELNPADWRLMFAHTGWKVVSERTYLQYPRRGLWRIMQPLWRWWDFEGFWGAVLQPDFTWSELYQWGPARGASGAKVDV